MIFSANFLIFMSSVRLNFLRVYIIKYYNGLGTVITVHWGRNLSL
jgi:hypothetical protein